MEITLLQARKNDLTRIPFLKSKIKNSEIAQISFTDYIPKRFALQYSPPIILLEYLVPSSGKLYIHKMPLPHLNKDSKPEDILKLIKKKNIYYLVGNKISDFQIICKID